LFKIVSPQCLQTRVGCWFSTDDRLAGSSWVYNKHSQCPQSPSWPKSVLYWQKLRRHFYILRYIIRYVLSIFICITQAYNSYNMHVIVRDVLC